MVHEMNPRFWTRGVLKPKVRNKMVEICDFYKTQLKIPRSAISDVVFTGSLTGFNYFASSDVDLHFVLNPSKIQGCREKVDDYYRIGCRLINYEYDISIYKHQVEVYMESTQDRSPYCSGRYSLLKNEFLTSPCRYPTVDEIQNSIEYKTKLRSVIHDIRYLTSNQVNSEGPIKKLKRDLYRLRSQGLASEGVNSYQNFLYRDLRQMGLLKELDDYLKGSVENRLSLR